MSSKCIFCQIAAKEIPVTATFESEHAIVFPDINPVTPVHHLVIPKKHLATINDVTADDRAILGDVIYAAAQAAKLLGVAESGYRLVANTNGDAGQEVFHIHFHLLAGRGFRWPPG
jgi:histidine triad (HIT) family protein